MGQRDMERSGISEVVREKLYFAVLHRPEDLKATWLPGPAICFSVDNELLYEPFYADFGPLNLACTYHFCMKLSGLLQEGERHGRCVCFCCSSEPKKKPNAAVLLGAYLVLFEGWDAEAAYNPLSEFEPFLPFRDPTCGISTYHLSVLDCIRAMAKGKKIGWIDLHTFNIKEYEYFEQVENGDLNWIVPSKILAFSGPCARRTEVSLFSANSVATELLFLKTTWPTSSRLKSPLLYDSINDSMIKGGLQNMAWFIMTCIFLMAERIVQRFLEIVDDSPGAVAVHCKAGLGRTGVLIGCYLMKNFRFTANEAIGYLRILRPGSVIGPQQHFLRDMQSRMWKAGDALRRHRSESNRNSRLYVGPPAQDRHSAVGAQQSSNLSSPLAALSLTGPQIWGQAKGSGVGFRVQSINLDGKRSNPREAEYLTMEASSECRKSYSQEGLQSRATVSQRCSRPSYSRGSGSLCLSMDTCLEQTRRPSSGNEAAIRCPYNLRPRPSTMQPNSTELNGILRCNDVKTQAVEGVCTQRTLNAAGQPRKVVVAMNHVGVQNASPTRRRNSSPLRYSTNQG